MRQSISQFGKTSSLAGCGPRTIHGSRARRRPPRRSGHPRRVEVEAQERQFRAALVLVEQAVVLGPTDPVAAVELERAAVRRLRGRETRPGRRRVAEEAAGLRPVDPGRAPVHVAVVRRRQRHQADGDDLGLVAADSRPVAERGRPRDRRHLQRHRRDRPCVPADVEEALRVDRLLVTVEIDVLRDAEGDVGDVDDVLPLRDDHVPAARNGPIAFVSASSASSNFFRLGRPWVVVGKAELLHPLQRLVRERRMEVLGRRAPRGVRAGRPCSRRRHAGLRTGPDGRAAAEQRAGLLEHLARGQLERRRIGRFGSTLIGGCSTGPGPISFGRITPRVGLTKYG